MDNRLKEVEIYLARQQERLEELYRWEKSLDKIIELKEAKLNPEELREAREYLRKEELINGLENKILELQSKLNDQIESKERIKEITHYRESEEAKLKDVLSYKEPLLKQKQADEKEAEEAKSKKTAILQEIADKIIGANKEVEAIKSQKQSYADDLDAKEKRLILRTQEIANQELKLATDKEEGFRLKQYYGIGLEQVNKERTKLKKDNELTEAKAKELDAKFSELKNAITEINKAEAESKKKLAEITKEKETIAQTSGLLELEREGVEKTRVELDEKQKRIEKDREHLYSQQSQLKNARDEFIKKGIIK